MSFLNNNALDAIEIGVLIRADEALLRKTEEQLKALGKTLTTATTVDTQKINQSNAAITRFAAQARAEAVKNTASYEKFRQTLENIERQKTFDSLSRELAKAYKSGQTFDEVMASVEQRLKNISASGAEVGSVIQNAAVQASNAGNRGAAIAAFGREARLAVPAIPIPGTNIGSESIFRVVQLVGTFASALGPLLPVLAAAAVGITALALAIQESTRQFEEAKQATLDNLDAEGKLAYLREKGSKQEVEDQIKNEKESRDRALAVVDSANRRFEDQLVGLNADQQEIFRAALASGTTNFQPAAVAAAAKGGIPEGSNLNLGVLSGIAETLNEQTSAAEKATRHIGDLNNVLGDTGFQSRAAQEELKRIASQDVLTRLQAAAQAQQLDANALEERIQGLRSDRIALQDALKQTNLTVEVQKQLEDQLHNTNIQLDVLTKALPAAIDVRNAEEARKRQQDAQETIYALQQRTLDLDRQGRERLAAIVEQGDKQIQAAEERLSDARVKLVDYNIEVEDKRNDINQSYMADDLERLADFRRKEQRITRDADKERIRDLEDHNQNLLDAEAANDVSAFLQEKRNFDKEQRRKQEDQQTALGDRLDDLSQERDKLIQVRDEKLAALDAEATKKRADLAAEIADRDQALIDVKQNIEEQKQAQIKAQDEALRRLVAGLDTSINTIVAEGKAAFAILKAAGVDVAAGIVGELRRQSNPYYDSPYQTSNQNLQASGYSGGANIPLVRLTGFAQGVKVVNQPTLGVFGERPGYNEALIPYRHGESLLNGLSRMGLSGAGGQQFNFDFSGADFGSHNEQRIKDTVITAVAMSMHGLRTGQRPA